MSRRTAQLDIPGLDGLRNIDTPETDARKCRHGALDLETHVVPRIFHAQVDVGPRQNEPVGSILVSPKSEEDDDPLIGQAVDAHQSTERPHEKIGIEPVVLEILARPVVSPYAEGF